MAFLIAAPRLGILNRRCEVKASLRLNIFERGCVLLPSVFADSGLVGYIDDYDAGIRAFDNGELPAAFWDRYRIRLADMPNVSVATREDEEIIALLRQLP